LWYGQYTINCSNRMHINNTGKYSQTVKRKWESNARKNNTKLYSCPKSLQAMGILFIIYYLHYMLCIFTPTLYAFSRPPYHVCAYFAQCIGIDSSTRVCNSGCLALNSSANCLWVYFWRPLRRSPPFHPMLMPVLAF
jgi:hypothetical protein